jgi:glucose/arabinose dehydrogenase
MTRVHPRLAGSLIGFALPFALPGVLHGELVQFAITLDGSQQVPPVTTPATGAGTATLDTDTNLLSWNIAFSGLSTAETASHFHGNAPQCANAGVQITLPPGSPKIGSATLSGAQEAAVLQGLWYVNVHSVTNPGGEIRGQVMPAPIDDPLPDVAPGEVHLLTTEVAAGLAAPIWAIDAPGHPDRLFVADQAGILWSVDLVKGGRFAFLDVTERLVDLGIFGPGSFDERGLLGVAFHPGYAGNGLLYTYTSEPTRPSADFSTMPDGFTANHQTVILEWQVLDPMDPGAAVDPGSVREIMRIDQPQFNHNAGCLNFGPDAMLYIALGDGGAGDDQETGVDPFGIPNVGHGCDGNGQAPANPLGSILRIDPQGTDSANGQYGIPADNPFAGAGAGGPLAETFAYGFRNPFRFSFDTVGGDLYAADVGQNHVEEVDVVVAGGNYGWNHKEGSFYFVRNGALPGYVTDRPLSAPADLIDPIAQYDHGDGIAIIGGFVYRGARIGPWSGRYVFGEFAQTFSNDGRLFYLDDQGQVVELQFVGGGPFGRSLLGMGRDSRGEVYALANSTGAPFGATGVVLRLAPRPGDTNADGALDVTDLVAVVLGFGPCAAPPQACAADVNGDGQVDVQDLVAVILNWG